MDRHQYHYSSGAPLQNTPPPRPDFSSGTSHTAPFLQYRPPVPPQNTPPSRPDFHSPPPQIMPFGVYGPLTHPQNMSPWPTPQQNMPPRAGVHQHPGNPSGSWPWFSRVPHDGASNIYSSHPAFSLDRPPPGYFPSPSPGTANLQPELRTGIEGGWVQSQIHQDNLDSRSIDDKFHPLGPVSHQQSFQSNRNVMAHCFGQFPHGPVSNETSSGEVKSHISDVDGNQRKQDEQWIKAFLHKRKNKNVAEKLNSPDHKQSISEYKEKLYKTVQMLSELSSLCQRLKTNVENEDSYRSAVELRRSLQDRLNDLTDPGKVALMKKKLRQIKTKRSWMRRKKGKLEDEKREQQAQAAEKEAAIDKRQMKQIQEIEEKKKERELKLAADSVLSEVRRKQTDTNRMVDVLKALEKLRKLRKEAASRKGLFPEKKSDEVFEAHLMRLRNLIRKRTAVYGAEEKALRVMLEGEQEEERKRERDKRQKKEKEQFQQKKREIDSMLFGADLPPDHPLQMYQQFYTQAECSLPVLIQIRRDWDQFLVPLDHPDGSSVPWKWVLPETPADDVWAAALGK